MTIRHRFTCVVSAPTLQSETAVVSASYSTEGFDSNVDVSITMGLDARSDMGEVIDEAITQCMVAARKIATSYTGTK